MKIIFAIFCLLSLSSCVSGSFGNHQDIEEYPLRSATKDEAKDLKRCLRSAYQSQQKEMESTGKYFRKVSELSLDGSCQGFLLAMKHRKGGYLVTAQFHSEETTVRWTINQDGVIEDYLDPQMDDEIDF